MLVITYKMLSTKAAKGRGVHCKSTVYDGNSRAYTLDAYTLCVLSSRKSHQERPIGLGGGLQSTRHPVYSTPNVIQATIESNDATNTKCPLLQAARIYTVKFNTCQTEILQ